MAGTDFMRVWEGRAEELVRVASTQFPAPVRWLRAAHMRTREGFLNEWAAVAQFPPTFGQNWDAFRDALADLPGGGTFLILEAEQVLQDASPEEGAIWMQVLATVAQDLAPKPFLVLLQAERDHYPGLLEGLKALGSRSS